MSHSQSDRHRNNQAIYHAQMAVLVHINFDDRFVVVVVAVAARSCLDMSFHSHLNAQRTEKDHWLCCDLLYKME